MKRDLTAESSRAVWGINDDVARRCALTGLKQIKAIVGNGEGE